MKREVPGYYRGGGGIRLRGRAAPGRRPRREGGLAVVLLDHAPRLALRGRLRPVGAAAQARGGRLWEEARGGGLPRHRPDARGVRVGYAPAYLGMPLFTFVI